MRSISRSSSGIFQLTDRRSSLRHLTSADWALLVASVSIAVIGVATVHSASSELAVNLLPRQALWVGLGLIAMVVFWAVDYGDLMARATWLYVFGLALLVAVWLFGYEAGGAQSRLALGPISIQPSELAKLTTALLLARYLAGVRERYLALRHLFVAGLIVAVPVVMVAMEPDFGSAAMFLPMTAGMVLVAGIRPRLLITTALLGAVIAAGVWTFATKPYQQQRVLTFLNPDSDPLGAGYQVRQSKIAVGSGGFWGQGYRQGTQSQLRFLPARHTDFVFAVLAEEWGFAGVFAIFVLYSVLLAGAVQMALAARDRAGLLLMTGLLSLLGFHLLYNTAMVVGLVPITGIPLPFLSYGGSFTLSCFAMMGLFLSVHHRRYVNR
ncbi:MAG: rod shape-determining protein RodA [Acidobacteriota bacterium]